MLNLKCRLAGWLINTGVALLPEEARTQTTIHNMMLTRMIKGVKLDLNTLDQDKLDLDNVKQDK